MAKKIIIADDEPVVRQVLKQVLQSEGYDVIEAENGEEAVKLVKSEKPDLLILDVRMPVMDGMQACRVIRQLDEPMRNVPIIILTAVDTTLGRRVSAELGVDMYLTKPISPKELRSKVRELVGPP
ncbi:MAG: response regulator [Armatimonadota bacterium]|nr:response regulator [Armatimonadota bacterium]MCX7777344.1 response regulator [Armatimonadota bacterium]MDW8025388.1 response regulator [Armatimonadota bacterium]